MALTISGHIQSIDSPDAALEGYRVEALFEQVAPAEPATSASMASKVGPGRVSARTGQAGDFRLSIPDGINTLHFAVSGPAGQSVGKLSREISENTDDVVIPVSTQGLEPIVLDLPGGVPQAPTRRITGQVLDRAGKTVPANSQVLLFARRSEGEEVDAPVLAARTDRSGNFFGEVPNQWYECAAALVSGVPDEIAIALDEGLIPSPLMLVFEVPERTEPEPKKPCYAVDPTPRTPSQEDIGKAPDTYSTDLGTGRCAQFNTPNRAIEEFDFYTVVRTTEPDIVGFTTAGDPMVGAPGSEGTLATVAAAAAATAAAEAAKAAATAAATEAKQAEAIAIRHEALAATFEFARTSLSVNTVLQGVLLDRRGVNWSAQKARDLVSSALNVGAVPPHAAADVQAVTEVLVAAIAAVPLGMVWSNDSAVIIGAVQSILTTAASAPVANAQAARATADAKAAKAARAAAAAAESVQAAQTAEAAKAAEIAARAQALEAEARAQLEARGVRNKPPGREELNRSNPIDWDETPTFYQAAEIAHGHLLHFKQVWYADGYSLGDLLYSLPLAPGQKKLISVVDWERRERTERTEATFGSESLTAALSRDRDLGEVVTGALTESSRGGSRSTSAGVGAGTGAAGNGSYQAFNFGALIGVSGGYGESNSNAWIDSARNLSSGSLQELRDRTLQSASAVRGLRSSVVHTVAQGETVRATTEVVANHNHCHTVTIQYFEVLRHLKLQHELADVQECLLVPLPMSAFDRAKALRWRQSLQTYLQRRELAGGFDAARRVHTRWAHVDAPLNRYADEHVLSLAGELRITVLIPLPPFPERPKPRPQDPFDPAQAMAEAVNPTTGVLGVLLAIGTGGASLLAGEVTKATIATAKEAAKGARALADELFAEPSPQERYDKFHHEIVPGVVEGFINQLELWARVDGGEVRLDGVDFTLVSDYQPGVPLLVSLRATLAGQRRRWEISQLVIKSAKGLPPTFRAIVNSATIRYSTSSFEHTIVDDPRVNDDIDAPKAMAVFSNLTDYEIKTVGSGKGATLSTPIDAWEQRSPRKDDERLTAELIEHLNDNLEYYHHAIWWTMDPNRRYMLLDGYFAPGSNKRSVASVVENRIIGIVGNSVVLPVARGNHLDPRFVANSDGNRVELKDIYKLASPVPDARVSLPTRGVFAEAVMGACNACEEKDDSKFWRWEESPIDEPPSIDPLSTSTRRAEPGSVTPSPFPTPMVSIQNAPAAPDPAGVRTALDALGKQSFADITGLAGTQANAAAAYGKAMDTALQFGKEASTLAQQAAMLKGGIDRTMGAIDKAEAAGKVDAGDAKQLRLSALKKMIGGDTEAGMTASSATERMKLIQDAVKGTSISPEVGQALTKDVLKSYVADGNQQQGVAAINLMERMGGEQVTMLRTPDGTEVHQAVSTEALALRGPGPRPVILSEDEEADAKAATMMANAQRRQLTDGTMMIPGSIIAGRTLLVDADDTFAYYLQEGRLWRWGTRLFYRDQYIDKFGEEVIGTKPLVALAYIEIAFLSGLFAALPGVPVWLGGGLVGKIIVEGTPIVGAHLLDKGLKLYHHRGLLNDAVTATRKLLAARDCLKQAAPAVLEKLENTLAWEAIKNLPSQVTAKQIAFWLGRVFRGVGMIGAELTFGNVIAAITKATAALTPIIAVVNTPAALQTTLDQQARMLVQALASENMTLAESETRDMLLTLATNGQARQCLDNLRLATQELLPLFTELRSKLLE